MNSRKSAAIVASAIALGMAVVSHWWGNDAAAIPWAAVCLWAALYAVEIDE